VAIRITAIHVPDGHDEVAELEWISIEHKNEGCSTRDAMIDWLESDSRNIAFVGRGSKTAPVRVVRDGDRVRLTAGVDGSSADKLLQLPRY
jgi:hypothetical protein